MVLGIQGDLRSRHHDGAIIPAHAASLAHPDALRVEQRLRLEPGRPSPADDLDLEAGAARAVRRRELGRHVPERDRLPDVMPVPARGHPADDRAVVPDRLVADDVRRVVGVGFDDERDEPPLRAAGGFLGLVRRPRR